MWLLDILRENYEVPVALLVGLFFLLCYRRLLKAHPEDDRDRRQERSSKEEAEGSAHQTVKHDDEGKKDRPRDQPSKQEDNCECPPTTTKVKSLPVAVRSGDVEAVRAMLKDGANPNTPDRNGNTCLHVIFQDISTIPEENAIEILELLLNNMTKGIGIDAVNKDSRTSLQLAVRNTTPSLVRLLLDGGADRTIPDKDGNTPLHTIIEYMQFSSMDAEGQILDLLLKHYPSGEQSDDGSRIGINALNSQRLTPLHLAFTYEETDNVRLLLQAGADPNIPDGDGNTPLHTVLQNMNQEQNLSPQSKDMVTLLLDAKANVLLQNKKGESVLCIVKNPDVEEMIINT